MNIKKRLHLYWIYIYIYIYLSENVFSTLEKFHITCRTVDPLFNCDAVSISYSTAVSGYKYGEQKEQSKVEDLKKRGSRTPFLRVFHENQSLISSPHRTLARKRKPFRPMENGENYIRRSRRTRGWMRGCTLSVDMS